jgi:hypothetical protein
MALKFEPYASNATKVCLHATKQMTLPPWKKCQVEDKTLFAKYLEHVTSHLIFPLDLEPTNKKPHITLITIFLPLIEFFVVINPFAKHHGPQKGFLEDDILYVIKGFLPLRTTQFIWFQRLVYKLCLKVVFPYKNFFAKEVILAPMQKKLPQEYVQHTLAIYVSTMCTFDFWMSKRTHIMFIVWNVIFRALGVQACMNWIVWSFCYY